MTKQNSSHSQNEIFIALESAYSLIRLGDQTAAHVLLNEIIEKTPLHGAALKIKSLLEFIELYELKKLSKDEHSASIEKLLHAFDHTQKNIWSGWIHFLQAYLNKNETEYANALKYFKQGTHCSEYYEAMYWMNSAKLLPNKYEYNLFLHCYPAHSIYSIIMGNTLFEKEISPQTVLQKDQVESYIMEEDFDCWYLSRGNVTPAYYKDLILNDDENLLDLFSGIIVDRGEYIYLMVPELNCLSLLISSQLVGMPITQLNELLGRTDSQVTITRLQQMGFRIKNIDNFFKISFEETPKIIIPRSLKVLGLQELIKKTKKEFTKSVIVDTLQITDFGADTLIKKWAKQNIIIPVKKTDDDIIWAFKN